MNILIASDSFKGSASSKEINEYIKDGLLINNPNFNIETLPLSDGGEGFIDVLKNKNKFMIQNLEVTNSNGKIIKAYYLYTKDIAIIESAMAVGITNLKSNEINSYTKTSYGVGEMIIDALSKNVKKIILSVGGTATNDAGIGILAALGASFYDINGNLLSPIAKNLININTIDTSKLINTDTEFIIATDVKNLLYGNNGATKIYGYQKCFDNDIVDKIENGIIHYAKLLNNNKQYVKGSGAGGGIPYSLLSFFNTKIVSGFDVVKKYTNLTNKIKKADIVITGEGKIDNQTLNGKLPYKLCVLAKKYNKKVIAICGVNKLKDNILFDNIISLIDDDPTENDLKHTKENVLKISNYLSKLLNNYII